MINQEFMLKTCAKTVGAVSLLFIILFALERKFLIVGILVVLCTAILMPCQFLAKPSNIRILSYYLIVNVNILLFIVVGVTGNIEASAPLYICTGAMAALFFNTTLVKVSFISGALFYLMQCIILSIQAGALINSPVVLLECLIAILVSFFLVYFSVKTGNHYLKESNDKQIRAEELLASLDQKSAQTEAMLQRQQQLLHQIELVADQVSDESISLSTQSDSLANSSTEQASSMELITNAVGDISHQIRETASQAQQVRDASELMQHHVNTGGEHMSALLNAVGDIESSMRSIQAIIKTIDDIAFQTNILALNAAVEAARAGNAGRGFAVVADEVRSLASNSAEAARSTIDVLEGCQEAVKRGTQVAGNTSTALECIKASVEDVTHRAFHISDMTCAQLTKVDQINDEIDRACAAVQSTAASAEECAATVKELSAQAGRLHTLSQQKSICR